MMKISFVDGVRFTDAPGRRNLPRVINTIAHEIGHTLLEGGHPDEQGGPAPFSPVSNHRKRLMASGAIRELGIQLVKKEWDEAEEKMQEVIDSDE